MSKNVLVTGGLGYIGGRVCQHISRESSIQLRVGTRDYQQLKPDWLNNGCMVNFDLIDQNSLDKACDGVHSIVHLAAINEHDCAANPEQALIINSLGSVKLLNSAIKAGVQRFIYVSTAHIYGSPLSGTLTEESLPRPQHPYAITHKTAEDYILAAHDKGQINAVVLRLSNGFGYPERASVSRWTLLVNDLCKQAMTSKKIALHSSGNQVRDFITLADVARAVEHVLNMTKGETSDGLFNLGGEYSMRIIDMAEIIVERCKKVFGLKLNIERMNPDANEISTRLEYSMEKIKSTGFTLRSNFNEEIDGTLKLCHDSFGLDNIKY
ncbi:MAG: SDR family oxidoreductase [Proteobacteria bacterium]|nr:SDR family oxidoreductase [Pseudomonadota bacterium]NOG59094.1 SDR family oxidoreductase [Pseudomonadota bacterium]